jgi:two-component system sensor kinase FixL
MPAPHGVRHDRYLSRYLAGGAARIIGQGREETAVRADGTRFPIHLSVGRAEVEGQTHFVGIIRDLSVQKRAQEAVRELEQQLIHADRLILLGELTAGIAHEINQPLTAIAAYADAGKRLLSEGRDTGGDLQVICERVAEQARRAAEVVSRLRRLARRDAVRKGEHDLNQIISNILLVLDNELEKNGVEMQIDVDAALPPLNVDDVQIQQVLVNLVKNAIDAIDVGPNRPGRIELSARKKDQWIEISVVDNGPGVEPSVVPRLFEPFCTTKPQGLGLGLAICKNIAGAHGGGLSFEPALNGGSRFVLVLPADTMG